jgi:DNA-binding CsgD family transcriptional regulator
MTDETPDLTPEEVQVLGLVVQGRTNAQIRAELGLTAHTLATILGQLYRKSGLYVPSQSYTPTKLRQSLVGWGRRYFAQ